MLHFIEDNAFLIALVVVVVIILHSGVNLGNVSVADIIDAFGAMIALFGG